MSKRNRILAGIILITLLPPLFFYFQYEETAHPAFGLNFSIHQAEYLGFDWKELYLDMLEELRPKHLRIMAYWDILEPARNNFQFDEIDFLVSEAQKRNIKTILVLGHKQPRWPECHEPEWAQNLESRIQNAELLEYIEAVINRYKDNPAIAAWQIENEPFFEFGPHCPKISRELFKKELELVKSLDPRPIVVTDSGEKGAWLPVSFAGGEIFGSTMYRTVYHHQKRKYITYPIPPAVYKIKAGVVRWFTGIEEFAGVELQAEPWFDTDPYQMPLSRQLELMNPEIFSSNVQYARKVGFAENYLWGVEWWYYLKENFERPELWQSAKNLLLE